jgi:hypothetical protein
LISLNLADASEKRRGLCLPLLMFSMEGGNIDIQIVQIARFDCRTVSHARSDLPTLSLLRAPDNYGPYGFRSFRGRDQIERGDVDIEIPKIWDFDVRGTAIALSLKSGPFLFDA